MKVCFVYPEFPPEILGKSQGGIVTYLINTVKAFSELVEEIHLVVPKFRKGDIKEYDIKNLYVHRYYDYISPPMYQKILLPKGSDFIKIFRKNIIISNIIKDIIDNYKIDIIEIPDWGADYYLSLKKNNIPVSVRVLGSSSLLHMYGGKKSESFTGTFTRHIEKVIMESADVIISSNRILKEMVIKEMSRLEDKIRIIPYPIDLKTFSPGSVKSNEKVILYVGRLQKIKGIDILARAINIVAKEDTKARFVFIGLDLPHPQYGTVKNYLKHLINPQFLSMVNFYQDLEVEEVVEWYRRSYFVVVPSYFDAYPYTAIEAMSCGKPVIGTRRGGIPEIISDGKTGILIDYGDIKSLADVILRLLKNEHLALKMGINARKMAVERYNPITIGQQIIGIYKETIKKRRIFG